MEILLLIWAIFPFVVWYKLNQIIKLLKEKESILREIRNGGVR